MDSGEPSAACATSRVQHEQQAEAVLLLADAALAAAVRDGSAGGRRREVEQRARGGRAEREHLWREAVRDRVRVQAGEQVQLLEPLARGRRGRRGRRRGDRARRRGAAPKLDLLTVHCLCSLRREVPVDDVGRGGGGRGGHGRGRPRGGARRDEGERGRRR
jgi:hypothetical protein